jgi:hypothetical protein
MITITLRARYEADVPPQMIFTLVTATNRMKQDIRSLKILANSVRTCSSQWSSGDGKSKFVIGIGRACPADSNWF